MDFYLIFLIILFPERISLSRAERILGTIVGDNSDVEDLSDTDDPVGMRTPFHSPLSPAEDVNKNILRCKKQKHCVQQHLGVGSQQAETDGSNDGPEEPTPGPSHQGQSKKGTCPNFGTP